MQAHVIGTAMIALAIYGGAAGQAAAIELDRLIQMFSIPTGASYNVIDWTTGSRPGTLITWQHAGIKNCDPYLDKQFGTASCREGKVRLTVRGKVTHEVLGRLVEPGLWTVRLLGARVGAFYVTIESDNLSHELGAGLLSDVAAKSDSVIRVASIRKCGLYSDSAELFSVAPTGHQPVFIYEQTSCGSGGCSVWFTLALKESDAKQLVAQSTSCQ